MRGLEAINRFPLWDFGTGAGFVKKTITYSDLSTAATTNNSEIVNVPDGFKIYEVYMHVSTAFAGGTITDYQITVGIASNNSLYGGVDADTLDAEADTEAGYLDRTASTSLKAYATSTGGNLDQATAGVIDIYYKIQQVL